MAMDIGHPFWSKQACTHLVGSECVYGPEVDVQRLSQASPILLFFGDSLLPNLEFTNSARLSG